MIYVPVVDLKNKPLMPTTQWRAARWIKSGKATPFWKKGVFCVRLNQKPSGRKKQPIAVGIDPGSKKEGFTVKSASHTYLNIQADAVYWVDETMRIRKQMRIWRRGRNTPCRPIRLNRATNHKTNKVPPSTKARWQWKLRILSVLRELFPISHTIVEDIKASTRKGQAKWNKVFSPLELGKTWFYQQIIQQGSKLETKQGWETKELRDSANLDKCKNKLSTSFDAHCVDSWVLANSIVGGHILPDNKQVIYIKPLRFHKRRLHALEPRKGGIRRIYGGTVSLGFKRGSLVKHPKYGVAYVGGTSKGRISLHKLDGTRLAQNVKAEDCRFLTFNSWGLT